MLGSHRPAGTPDHVVVDSDPARLVVLPFFMGEGMRLTPSVGTDTGLTLESEHALPGGPVEIVYAVGKV